ncbi:MAG: alpha/beta hydrolase [Gemmatimonadota bacterium]
MSLVAWVIAAGLAVAVYGALMVARNRRLVPLPLLDAAGTPLGTSRFTFSDGVSVEYVDTGSGPVLLLVPGADGIKETFRFQAAELSRRYRVICPDLRAAHSGTATFDRFTEDVRELLDALGVERLVLLGQSLGGAITMRFATLYPERAEALILANTLARVSYDHVGLNRTGLGALAMFTTRYFPTAVARALGRLWCRLGVWLYDNSAGWRRTIEYALWSGGRVIVPAVSSGRVDLLRPTDLRPDLPAIRAPTLILKGPVDTYVPPAWSKEIASLIPGSRYVEIPETGHISHVSMSDEFNRIVLEWLAERKVQQ